MLNSWSTRSNEQNQAKITEVILPLVIDNNIKATEVMSRLSIKHLFPDVRITDSESNSAPKVSVTHTPQMQQLLAKFGEKAELDKTLKKGNDSTGKRSSGPGSYSSFKGSGRNNHSNYSDSHNHYHRSGSGSSSNSNRSRGSYGNHPRNGRGRGGFSNYRRGGSGGGGHRNYSDKDRSSSFKAKDKSSSSSSSSSSKDKSSF
jgi:hypothetical protein